MIDQVKTMMISRIDVIRRAATVAALVTLAAGAGAGAQSTADPRWAAWLGCWQPSPASVADLPASLPFVCVSPTNVSSAVEIATIANGAVVTHDTVDASGKQRPVEKQGCSGWQRAEWSADVRRVFLRSELSCAGGVTRTSTGILAMSPTGEWLDVQSINAGSSSGVRAMRYHGAGAASIKLPPGVIDVSAGRDLAVQTARAAAGTALNVGDVVEAVKRVDTAVVQTWIVQRGVRFVLNANQLVAMADAGVPGSVTDVMIGVSYPDHFALQQPSGGPMTVGNGLSRRDSAQIASDYLASRCIGGPDPLWYSLDAYDPCSYRYGARGLGYGYGYSPYGYRPYGYNGYYGGSFGGGYYSGYYSAPVIVVKGEETAHGKLINGRGYTRGDASSSSGSTASGASSTRSSGSGSSSSGSSSSGSGSSGSSSSGSSSSGGSSGGRTAVARPPK
jgi:hypothetical protein